ncbi:hypothetical protein, partial [Pseudomonas protegens]|uniref:hypothetical protein n=1 Tax=Pseudomonas protegens TaxID=380021 RepID=UPI001B33F1DA
GTDSYRQGKALLTAKLPTLVCVLLARDATPVGNGGKIYAGGICAVNEPRTYSEFKAITPEKKGEFR